MAEDLEEEEEELEDTTSTGSGPAASTASGMGSYLPMAGAALVGTAVLGAILLLSLHGSSKSAERLKAEEGGGGGGGGGEAPAETSTAAATTPLAPPSVAAEPPTKPPTTTKKKPTKRKTTAEATQAASTVATTAEEANSTAATTVATTKKPKAKKPALAKWMMCVFGHQIDAKLIFPEDGLCDFHFFQAMEDEGAFLEGKGAGPSLDAFTAAAAKHSKTEYGISLDFFHHLKTLQIISTPLATTTVEGLWKKKMYHWGYLNVEHYSLKTKNVTDMFMILRDLKKIVDRAAVPPRPHYFFFRDSFSTKLRKDRSLNYLREIFWMDGFVVLTHQINDDRFWASGRILPPTFWISLNMPDSSYKFSLASGHETLDFLSKEDMNGTVMYLTVTMAARRYIPDEKNAYLAEMQNSNETLIVNIVDYCKNEDYEFSFSEDDPIAPYYFSPKEERFITFDDDRSLGIKFCQGKKERTGIKYGMAVFDVEMDDPNNKCGKGAYKRLKFIRKLVDYMNNNFTSPGGFEHCGK